jgi:putative ATP-binding cassette transporter
MAPDPANRRRGRAVPPPSIGWVWCWIMNETGELLMALSAHENGKGSTVRQMRELLKMIRRSGWQSRIVPFSILAVAVIAANALVQIRLNAWQGNIYDAIALREISVFLYQLGVFAVIVSILLCLGVAQIWLQEMLKVRLRDTVTRDLLDEWLKPMRAYRLPLAGDAGANPDQRMQEDTRRLTDLTADLGVGLVQASLMLIAFTGVLWTLSAQVVFDVNGTRFGIPGYMVWCAIAYAGLGSFFTWLAGRSLVEAHSDLRAEEASFRFALVRASESSEMINLCGGESVERKILASASGAVIATMRRIASRIARLGWVTGAHGWGGLVVPMILAAPGYFGGTLTLGGLMMVVGAFYQVHQALRWYVDRFPAIAEWRAMLARTMVYREALDRFESLGAGVTRIAYAQHGEGKLTLDDVCVLSPAGSGRLDRMSVEIAPGEHVLIAGSARSGKSIFFRAIAGLWVWGSGVIRLPARETMMFLPQVPYIPLGSLRTALTYPAVPGEFEDAAIFRVLTRVRLDRFVNDLDTEDRWDKRLGTEEQHRLVLARVLLHRPVWVIQDESMLELDEESRNLAASIFSTELPGTAVVSFGRAGDIDHFYKETIWLRAEPPNLVLPLQFPDPGSELRNRPSGPGGGGN